MRIFHRDNGKLFHMKYKNDILSDDAKCMSLMIIHMYIERI